MEVLAIFTGCLTVLLAVMVFGEQRQLRQHKKRLAELEDREAQNLVAVAMSESQTNYRVRALEAVSGDHTKTINAIWSQLDIVQPEEIERRNLAGRLDADYKSLGQIVPNIDGMSLADLQEAQTVLAALHRWNARPETPEEIDADLDKLRQFSPNPMEDTDRHVLDEAADAASDAAQHPSDIPPWRPPAS